MLFPTSLVGSYPQPEWLIEREGLMGRLPPRLRASELWRVDAKLLNTAQDDATELAIADQVNVGLDIITDGEIRRESYSNRFATSLEGIDIENPGTGLDRSGHPTQLPRIAGEVRRVAPVLVDDLAFLRAHTDKPVKITIPGPFTMAQQAQNDFYPDERSAALAFAAAVNAEIRDLFEAGADVVQIDEPWLQARPEKARDFGLEAVNAALSGISGETAIHLCFGYAAMVHNRPSGYSFLTELAQADVAQVSIETAQSHLNYSVLTELSRKTIILGVIDLSTNEVERPDDVAARIRRALPFVDAERIVIAPDCGMKYLTRNVAYAKLGAMVEGASIVRRELEG